MRKSNKQLCEELIKFYETEIAFLTTHNDYCRNRMKRYIDTLIYNNHCYIQDKNYLQSNCYLDNENIIKENNHRLDCYNRALKGLKVM
jgi:hypothetical protein